MNRFYSQAGRFLFVFLLIILLSVSVVGCGEKPEKKKATKTVAMVFPVTVDAFVDFRVKAEKELSKNNVKLIWFSAEGDPSRFSTSVKSALLKKPDILVSVGTQITNITFGPQFEEDLPIVVASCISAPSKVEALVKVGIEPVRKKPVAILSDSPRENIYSHSAQVIQQIMGVKVKVGILYNTSEINSKNTALSLAEKLKELNIQVIHGVVSGEEDVTKVAKILLSKGATLLVIPHDKYVIKKAGALVKLGLEQETPVPLFSLDDGTVRTAGVAFGVSVSYGSLGTLTARTCLDILGGNRPEQLPIIAQDAAQLYINQDSLNKVNITLPEELISKAVIY